MKKELEDNEDVILLVDDFYKKAVSDHEIGFIFNKHMQASLEEHLPLIYSFWQSVLLGTMTYRGNLMVKHLELNKRVALEEPHFDRWLFLWNESVDLFFVGPKAEEAKQRAKAMKELMLYKIGLSKDENFIA